MHVGTVHYHRPSQERQAYQIDPNGDVGRLVSPAHDIVEITLHDQRHATDPVDFDTDGLLFVREPTQYPAPTDEGWAAAYEGELVTMLQSQIGAAEVVVFDHTVRIDDPDASRRPARNVHTDYSPEGARSRLVALLGEERAASWERGHYGFVNVWRPVGSVVKTAPLGFVRPRSVRPEDWVLLDLIYPDRIGQIMGLVHNPAHEWLMLSAMGPDEVAVFNIFDNRGRPPVAHSAIDLRAPVAKVIRTSVETRTLVRYHFNPRNAQ